MKAVIIADTHFALAPHMKSIEIPDGDLLIHCGDFDVYNREHFVSFCKWMRKLPHKYKVAVPGNHDVFWRGYKNGLIQHKGFTLLIHDRVEIEGIKIFGSPYTLIFNNWAFMYDKEHSNHIWRDVPSDIDVLVTHGPPYRILDEVKSGPTSGKHPGCRGLRNKVLEIKPRIHCFGHIHGGSGVMELDDIKFVNASVVDDLYNDNGREIVVMEI